MPCELPFMADQRIHLITFSKSDIIKVIRALNVNKTHDRNNILLRIIELCPNSAAHPLTLILQNSLTAGKLLPNGRKQILFQFIKRMVKKGIKLSTSIFSV